MTGMARRWAFINVQWQHYRGLVPCCGRAGEGRDGVDTASHSFACTRLTYRDGAATRAACRTSEQSNPKVFAQPTGNISQTVRVHTVPTRKRRQKQKYISATEKEGQ